ncbi:MAG TPA: metallophosphoesterase [Ignavibacteria bacterium]|nr:metallophosphoesterase [Ignavibacteria bacterium]HMR40191.1 metallophosphoesterase [Ignavibacteria bacterium]
MDDKKEVVKRDKEDYIDLTRSEAQNHYRTEATKEEVKVPEKQQTAVNKISDFFESKFFSWFFHYFKSRFGPRHDFQNYKGSDDNGIYKLMSSSISDGKEISIGLAGDWATDTNESDKIGLLIEKKKPDYTIHLGDTYFVGMKEEMKVNYINENSSWYRGKSGSFSLMGNHEMYSRGISYFRDLLPTLGIYSKEEKKYLGQKASYFCLENEHWRIISLDTGYNSVGIPIIEYIFKPKCGFHEDIIDWLKNTLDLKNDKRGLVFLTHHQYCSAFEEEYNKPAEQLAEIIGGDREVLWYWGHEHRLAVYGKFQRGNGITAYGRCIGNGGMPVEFKNKLKEDKAKECNLILHDQRKNIEIKNVDIGYNGFLIMKINDAQLKTEYFDINNKHLLTEEWTADNNSDKIKLVKMDVIDKELSVVNF